MRRALPAARPGTRRLLGFDLFLLAALICATRLGTLFHEVLGHALAARLGGARVSGVLVSLFAGGMTFLSGAAPGGSAGVFFQLSGILVNLATGGAVLALLFLLRERIPAPWALFGSMFALAGILGGLSYLTLASYYRAGDLAFAAHDPAGPWGLAWTAGLILAPGAAYLGFSAFLRPLGAYFPSRTFLQRSLVCLATLGLVLGAYFLLYRAEGRSLAMARAGDEARAREQSLLLAQKMEALARRIAAEQPELSVEEVRALVMQQGVSVSEKEMPRRFPVALPLVFLLLLGSALAVGRSRPGDGAEGSRVLGVVAPAAACMAAAAVLLFLSLRGGRVF